MNQHFISNCRGFGSESHKWFLTHKSRSIFKENSMCSSVLGQGRMIWLRTSSVSSCWEPICSSVLYEGWTIISVHDPLVKYYTCPIVYLLFTNALLWTTSYTCYTTIYHDKICMLKRNYLNKWINNYTNLPASPCSSNSIGYPPHLLQICMTTNTLVRHFTSGKKKMMKEKEVPYQEKKWKIKMTKEIELS